MSNKDVAWSVSSEHGASFTTQNPGEETNPYISAWTLDELVGLLNVTVQPEASATEEELRRDFETACSTCNAQGLSDEAIATAFSIYKMGRIKQTHSLIYALQQANALQELLKRRDSSVCWGKVEQLIWDVFAAGKTQHELRAKLLIDEIFPLVTKGNLDLDDWGKVLEELWRVYKDGFSEYRGCTKERLEELHRFIVKGDKTAL